MTFDQITYFISIVALMNFSRAAEDLFISESSLSKQIKSLETELKVSLISRDNYKIELTEAGKAFLPFAKKFQKEYSDMISDLSFYNNVEISRSIIKMGAIPILCNSRLITIFTNLDFENKNIHIDLIEREQSTLLTMLSRNQIDYAMVRTNYLPVDDYDFIPLTVEKIGVICSKNHHLASRKVLSLYELANENFILLNETSALYKISIDACQNAGFKPKVNYLTSRHEVLLAMVNTNLGLTLLPRNLLDLENSKNLKYIPLKETVLSTIGLVRNKYNNTNIKFQIFHNIVGKYTKIYLENKHYDYGGY